MLNWFLDSKWYDYLIYLFGDAPSDSYVANWCYSLFFECLKFVIPSFFLLIPFGFVLIIVRRIGGK